VELDVKSPGLGGLIINVFVRAVEVVAMPKACLLRAELQMMQRRLHWRIFEIQASAQPEFDFWNV
jgi:hypothetical protein